MRSIFLLTFIILALLSALPGFAQETKMTDVLMGKTIPLSLKLQQLDGSWRCMTPSPVADAAEVLVKMIVSGQFHQPLTANTVYTHGQTLLITGETYLIAYARPEQPLPVPTPGQPPQGVMAPQPLTAETELSLCLLNIHAIGNLLNIRPFDLKQELVNNTPVAMQIPRGMRDAMEATLKANLHELRNALEQFQADCGAYPANLMDLVAKTAPTSGISTDGKQVAIPAGAYKGPYLTTQGGLNNTGIPINPFVDMHAAQPDPNKPETHWKYQNGILHIADKTPEGQTLDGIPYNNL